MKQKPIYVYEQKRFLVDYTYLYGVVTWISETLATESKFTTFVLGEILILGSDGREPSGRLRKPSDFQCRVETFTTLPQAVLRALETSGALSDE